MVNTAAGTTSSGNSTESRLDAVFGALADSTRRRILKRLAKGPSSVGELAKPFAMSLPAVSKHLGVLERAGLLRRHLDGRFHRCELNADPLRAAHDFTRDYRAFWESTLDGLAKYLEAPAQKSQRRPERRRHR
jgi:DNA-binding transcriptional ArsR family regulator